jgi:hypothetical protein
MLEGYERTMEVVFSFVHEDYRLNYMSANLTGMKKLEDLVFISEKIEK